LIEDIDVDLSKLLLKIQRHTFNHTASELHFLEGVRVEQK
jgi:hypothetical protein